jgi:hypothetical protein
MSLLNKAAVLTFGVLGLSMLPACESDARGPARADYRESHRDYQSVPDYNPYTEKKFEDRPTSDKTIRRPDDGGVIHYDLDQGESE